MAFAATPVRRRRAAANRGGPGSLPLELVLLVCEPLNLRDRLGGAGGVGIEAARSMLHTCGFGSVSTAERV